MVDIHRRIIAQNPLLQKVYRQWYGEFTACLRQAPHPNLSVAEVGSGAGHFERYWPGVIKTDLFCRSDIRVVVSAESLCFKSGSLRALCLLGVLHHLREPLRFLKEAERCLPPGGRLILIEPSNSVLHKFLCKYVHQHEF